MISFKKYFYLICIFIIYQNKNVVTLELECNYMYEIGQVKANFLFSISESELIYTYPKNCYMFFYPKIFEYTKLTFSKIQVNSELSRCQNGTKLIFYSNCLCDVTSSNFNSKEGIESCQTKFNFCTLNLAKIPTLYMQSCFYVKIEHQITPITENEDNNNMLNKNNLNETNINDNNSNKTNLSNNNLNKTNLNDNNLNKTNLDNNINIGN